MTNFKRKKKGEERDETWSTPVSLKRDVVDDDAEEYAMKKKRVKKIPKKANHKHEYVEQEREKGVYAFRVLSRCECGKEQVKIQWDNNTISAGH